jgi:hypothetical protein
MSFYLALVSPLDAPLYELPFTSSRSTSVLPSNANNSSNSSNPSSSFPSWSTFTSLNGGELPQPPEKAIGGNLGLVTAGNGPEKERHMCQMVVHMGLDSVEEVMEGTGNLYVKFEVVPGNGKRH